MTKKFSQRIFYTETFFSVFLAIVLICLPVNKTYGADLEVKYPVVAGQTITANTQLPEYVKYLFNVGMFLGFFAVFISLGVAGAMYLLSPANVELRSKAKDRFYGALSGLLILALTYLIVATINPQLSVLSINSLPPVPPAPANPPPPGVYFYNQPNCQNAKTPTFAQSSVPDLGDLKNRVNSVKIVQDADNQIYYVSILYENPNFWGKCQYIDPNDTNCQQVNPFASSASVYVYDFQPNGDGVYFYRKSCFNKINQYFEMDKLIGYCNTNSGGFLKISNSEIGKLYMKNLESLSFIGVPPGEQSSLGGENISSIIIKGDYLVLFSYAALPGETCESATNAFCQEFPSPGDVNKLGPQQMKWEPIRNNSKNVIPNCVTIIPIKR